jgi:hypothetical protein
VQDVLDYIPGVTVIKAASLQHHCRSVPIQGVTSAQIVPFQHICKVPNQHKWQWIADVITICCISAAL